MTRLTEKPAPSRPHLDALIASAREFTRPTEPEGADKALRRFLYNWHSRRTDAVAKDDFWHGVANLAVELTRDMSVPKPKLVGKAALVALAVGALTMCVAVVGFLAVLVLWLV